MSLCTDCQPGWVAYSVVDQTAAPSPIAPPHHVRSLHGPGHEDCCEAEFWGCNCEPCRRETDARWPGWWSA